MHQLAFMCLMLFVMSCKKRNELPELQNDTIDYVEQGFEDKELLNDYFVYKSATTKRTNATKLPREQEYPWTSNYSKQDAGNILHQIENSIEAASDEASVYMKERSSQLRFYSLIELSPEKLAEFKATGSIVSRKTILDYVKGTVVKYDLENENKEKIELDSFLGTTSGGLVEQDGKVYETFGFMSMGLRGSDYLTLTGFVDIIIEIPAKYDVVEATQNDVGSVIEINGASIEIIEFTENVIHYLNHNEGESDFLMHFDNWTNNYHGVGVPQSLYKIFRQHPGMNYASFAKMHKSLGLDAPSYSSLKKNVWIFKSDEHVLQKAFFYVPAESETIRKELHVPVNIRIQ